MNIRLVTHNTGDSSHHPKVDVIIYPTFHKKSVASEKKVGAKKETAKTELNNHWPKDILAAFTNSRGFNLFKGNRGEHFHTRLSDGTLMIALGLGEKEHFTLEFLRREIASLYRTIRKNYNSAAIGIDDLKGKASLEDAARAIAESLGMANYAFDEYLAKKDAPALKDFILYTKQASAQTRKVQDALNSTKHVVEAIHFARHVINEPPNVLHSEDYSKRIQADAKKLGATVKCKVLGEKAMEKEGMGMFLSVNAGSHHDPQLVHLTYTPRGANSKTKHVALVGKGLTFDTGGYSVKPGESMVNMKFDMAGSATVYAAFRAAVKCGLKVKITCVLGITDNAIGPEATKPDSIVKARNGKSVEILNTDAEGRLVLGDCMDYACDLKPDVMIDAATLTGACLVALGSEICGLMGNDQKLLNELLDSAKKSDEYMWQLPIIPEFHNDMKSPIADLKNIGSSRFAGTSKAAAFLEAFVKNDVKWAHLDIAGVADTQGHLPYCPSKGASGLIIRTLVRYLAQQ